MYSLIFVSLIKSKMLAEAIIYQFKIKNLEYEA